MSGKLTDEVFFGYRLGSWEILRHNKRQKKSRVLGLGALILRPIGQRISYRYTRPDGGEGGMASVCVVYLGGLFHSSEEPEFAGFDFWLYSVSFWQTRVELKGLTALGLRDSPWVQSPQPGRIQWRA